MGVGSGISPHAPSHPTLRDRHTTADMTAASTQIRPIRGGLTQGYDFDLSFERALVWCLCTYPSLWESVGRHVDPDKLRDDRCKLLVKACRSIDAMTGTGPTSMAVLFETLAKLVRQGSVKRREVEACAEMLDQVEDDGLPDAMQVRVAAAEVLRKDAYAELTRQIVEANGKGQPLAGFAEKLAAVEQIGEQAARRGVLVGDKVWDHIAALSRIQRMPLGVGLLDAPMRGGVPPSTLTVIGADMGVGKTSMLVHIAGHAYMHGKRVLFFPTEEGVPETLLRLVAWLTERPMSEVEACADDAKEALRLLQESGSVGELLVEYMPQGTPIRALRKRIEQIMVEHPTFGGGFDVCVVDYGDRLSAGQSGLRMYDEMRVVFDGLRQIAVDYGARVFTGSQLKHREKKDRPPGAEDLSDSRWKGRVADTVITIWRADDDDPNERRYHVAKNRGPGTGTIVGPVPMDMEHGRIFPSLPDIGTDAT